jgi:hypothetical protein
MRVERKGEGSMAIRFIRTSVIYDHTGGNGIATNHQGTKRAGWPKLSDGKYLVLQLVEWRAL